MFFLPHRSSYGNKNTSKRLYLKMYSPNAFITSLNKHRHVFTSNWENALEISPPAGTALALVHGEIAEPSAPQTSSVAIGIGLRADALY